MSLRIKLMLALFVTGLATVAMVGGLTSYSVNSKFDTMRSHQAAGHFHHYMTAYLTEYGDWDTAISTESFDRFVQRKETEEGPPQGERASDMLERMPPGIDQRSHRGARPGGEGGGPGFGPGEDGRPGPGGRRPPEGRLGADGRPEQPWPLRGPDGRPLAGQPDDGARPPAYGVPRQPDGQRPPTYGAPRQSDGQFDGQRPPVNGMPRAPVGQSGQPRDGQLDGQRPPANGMQRPPDGQPGQPRAGMPDGQRPPAYGAPRAGGQPPEGSVPGQPRAGGDDGRMPSRDGIRPPPPDGIRPPPPDGQPWPPQDGMRPPPRDGTRPPPPDGMRPPPRDGMRPGPREGERPPQIQGALPPAFVHRAAYGTSAAALAASGSAPATASPAASGAAPASASAPASGATPAPAAIVANASAAQTRSAAGAAAPGSAAATASVSGRAAASPADAPASTDAAGQRDASGNDGHPDDGRPGDDPRRARDGSPFPPRPDDEDERGRRARDRERHGAGPPPFRFVLADKHYTVLLGAGQYGPGAVLDSDARAKARAIVINGDTVAYVSTEGVVTPSKQEQEFLDAMQSSLLAGAGAAAVLALGLGMLLAGGLSSRLSKLTSAVRAMQGGALRQQVPVEGKDEVATLAGAFNDMSEQLARSHEELKASHQTILEQAEQLKELSIRDALTSLYNRRHFDEQANTLYHQAVRYKRPISLVIGDIDFFKKINDNFSHATGDVVLRHVGEILRQHVRLSDLVARYGGEEFVLALPDTDGSQAAVLCDKLRNLIEAHPWHEVHPNLKVTMSMGVYADYAVGTAEAMLQKADELLYKAKESGRNRVCHA